jgi:hypothetical protein
LIGWHDDHTETTVCRCPLEQEVTKMKVSCLITRLELPECDMKGQDTERLARVLVQ